MIVKIFKDQKDLALLIVRIFIGIIFVAHGINKFQIGINTVSGFFASIGIPGAQFFAWFIALFEIVGGLSLIFGIFARFSALVLSAIMIIAILRVKLSIGLIAPIAQPGVGMELDLALLAGLLSILLQGSGKYTIGNNVFKKNQQNKQIIENENMIK